MKSPKIGLALGSGGARGFAHIGVIQTLEKYNIPIDYIAGSSIGAVIGAHYAKYKSSEKLVHDAFILNRKKGLQLFDPVFKFGIFKGEKFEKHIQELLQTTNFDALQIPFAAVATDLQTANSVVFKSGDLIKTIRASSSIPGFFQPLQYENKILGDGGLSNPVPHDVVKKMGADIVIAVNLDRIFENRDEIKIPSLYNIPIQSINILRHNLAHHSLANADIVLSPHVSSVGLIGLQHFVNKKKIEELIQEGVTVTEEMIPFILQTINEKKKLSIHAKLKGYFRKAKDVFF